MLVWTPWIRGGGQSSVTIAHCRTGPGYIKFPSFASRCIIIGEPYTDHRQVSWIIATSTTEIHAYKAFITTTATTALGMFILVFLLHINHYHTTMMPTTSLGSTNTTSSRPIWWWRRLMAPDWGRRYVLFLLLLFLLLFFIKRQSNKHRQLSLIFISCHNNDPPF